MPDNSLGSVLFADDDETVLHPTATLLRSMGFEVDTACTAQEALQALYTTTHDALLLDINMPGNERLELVRQLSQVAGFVPVVIMTGFPSFESAMEALRFGAVDYITKPPDLDELRTRLLRAIQRGHAIRLLDDAEQRVALLAEWLDKVRGTLASNTTSLRQMVTGGPDLMADPLANLSENERRQLSRREREVLTALAQGNQAQQIADSLSLSISTVRNHIRSVFVKLRVNSQVALLAKLSGARAKG